MAKTTQTKIAKTGTKITKIGGVVSAIAVIIGAITGVCSWTTQQVQNVVSEQISGLQTEIESNDKRMELQITRLELLNLIHNQPANKAEIEKVARYYFIELGGDWYMTGIYSEWATKYSGDVSFMTKES